MPDKHKLDIRGLGELNIGDKALKYSETLYRSLFENASEGIFLIKDYRIEECNPHCLKMFRYNDRSDLIGIEPASISPEFQPTGKRSDIAAKNFLDRAAKGEQQSFEWLHLRADGSDLYTEISLSSMNLDGEIYVLALLRDITARKQIENELIDLQAYLQLQIEKMPIGLIIWDTDFKVKSWNPSAEDIFGYSEDDVVGKHPNEIIVPKDIAEDTDLVLGKLIEKDESLDRINENITRSGRRIICSWNNTPFKNYDGEIIGVLSMVRILQNRAGLNQS